MLEIRTIGAGGGSIAAVDASGRLTVGPRSAGAVPGPVCYRRGGSEPTVTDANAVLGRLDARSFLGSAMTLDVEGARAAVATRIAGPLGLGVEQAAQGLLAVTDVSLASAIRLSLFEKGLDPRDFSILSFGGAGGLHAIPVAEELGITEVIFPPDASTFSAFGILNSDIVHDLARSRLMPATPASLPKITAACASLRRQGEALLRQDGLPPESWTLSYSADLRYRGQAFELVVPWLVVHGGDATPSADTLATLAADFHALHRQRFSYSNPGDPVDIVTLRLAAIGRLPRCETSLAPPMAGVSKPMDHPRIYGAGGWAEVEVFDRSSLGGAIDGPALIQEAYTTVYIAPGWRCAPGPQGDLIAARNPA